MEPVVDWRGDGRGERRSYWMSRYHSPTQHRCWNTSCFDLFIYIYVFFFSCLLLRHYWIIRVVYFPCLAELTLRKLCKDIGKEVDTVFDPNTWRFGSSLEVGHTWKRLRAAVAEAICCGGNTAARGREGAREGAAEMQEKQSQSVLFSSGFGSASEGRQIRRGRDTRAKFPHLGIMTCSHKCIISGRKPPCCRIN